MVRRRGRVRARARARARVRIRVRVGAQLAGHDDVVAVAEVLGLPVALRHDEDGGLEPLAPRGYYARADARHEEEHVPAARRGEERRVE